MSFHKVSQITIKPSAKHTATVIFLHGLGDDGNGWSPVFNMIKSPHVKYILPNAPRQKVTLNGGMEMPSWYDIYSLDKVIGREDELGIQTSAKTVHRLVEAEIAAGISSDRIVVGGFSQGGAISLYSGLTCPTRLAGIVALSCYLPLAKSFPAVLSKHNTNVPILQCHGDADQVVKYEYGSLSAEAIRKFNSRLNFKTYSGLEHNADSSEIADIKKFLDEIIP